MLLRGEAAPEGDIDDAVVGIAQKLLCALDALPQNVLMWTQAHAGAEHLREVRLA